MFCHAILLNEQFCKGRTVLSFLWKGWRGRRVGNTKKKILKSLCRKIVLSETKQKKNILQTSV